MKYFLSFQKAKGLYINPEDYNTNTDNLSLVAQIVSNLLPFGYILSEGLINKMRNLSYLKLDELFNDLIFGLKRITPSGTYHTINQSLSNVLTPEQNVLLQAWSKGDFNATNYHTTKNVSELSVIQDLTKEQFESIFTDLIHSNNSISIFDKEIISWFIDNGYGTDIKLQDIKFAEIRAFVGLRLLENPETTILGTSSATDVLRIWAAYSEGCEGLKTLTKFKQPKKWQKRVLLATLDQCWDLEDSFKSRKEVWLRMLYYLNPLMPVNVKRYPKLARFVDLVRNSPKELVTFNAKVEKAIIAEDPIVFELLKRKMGVFTRRLDHLVRIFDEVAIEKWLENKPLPNQLINIYNHFADRTEATKRNAILANAHSSELVTYGALEPLDQNLVDKVQLLTKTALEASLKGKLGKIFIDDILYNRPIASNNRASSLSIKDTPIGTLTNYDPNKVIRAYIAWEGSSDIDLSALLLFDNGEYYKVGWNGEHRMEGISYSGDNRGHFTRNAEYIQIDPSKLLHGAEYIVLDAKIYSGKAGTWDDYIDKYGAPVYAGIQEMINDDQTINAKWYPKNVSNSFIIANKSNTAFLVALHIPTGTMVHLDITKGNTNVSNREDALMIKRFVSKYVTNISTANQINWKQLNMGHVLNLCADEVVDDPKKADIVFDLNTTSESVSKYI